MPIQDACGDALSLASSGAERQQLLQAAAEALERLNGEETCGDLESVIYWWFRGNYGKSQFLMGKFTIKPGDLLIYYLPSGKHTKSYWKWPLIVDLPS